MNKKIKIIAWIMVFGVIFFNITILVNYRKTQTIWQYILIYAGYNKMEKNIQDRVIFLGDSITARENWNVLFGVSHIANAGFSGDTTDDILARLNLITSAKPEKIFLMIGVNDLLNGQDSDYVLKNYEKILAEIKKQSPNTKVYVQSVLPVNDDILKSETVNNKEIVSLNRKLEILAQDSSVFFVNLHPYFRGEGNNLSRKYSWDGLHLNVYGYAVWKKIIAQDVL